MSPSQKPITILDCFMGTGTTGMDNLKNNGMTTAAVLFVSKPSKKKKEEIDQ